jgi:RNA recognition motif-containing protein
MMRRRATQEVRPVASPTQIAPTISIGTPSSGLGDAGVKIYVGNLSFETTESEVNELFSAHGEVNEVALITDRDTGRPRGFGFVEMRNEQSARNAIAALDGTELGGRQLKVNEARAKTDRGGGQRRRW